MICFIIRDLESSWPSLSLPTHSLLFPRHWQWMRLKIQPNLWPNSARITTRRKLTRREPPSNGMCRGFWLKFYNKSFKKIYREISVIVPKNFSTEFRQNASIIMAISKARTLFQSSLFGWHMCDNYKGESYAQKVAGQTERKLRQKTAM